MKQLPSTNTLSRWEHFPHDADVGIRGFGPTAAAAFEQAACALTAAVTSSNVEPKGDVRPNARGPSGHARLEL